MKKIILILFTIQLFSLSIFSQNVALTSEVNDQNGIKYFKGKPFSGELYEFNEAAKTKCNCTMKAFYKNGKINGKYQSWYLSGKKKSIGNFSLGKKIGNHINWDSSGVKELEQQYKNGKIIEEKKYYKNGIIKSHIKYNPNVPSELMYSKYTYTNGSIEKETHFRGGKKHGKYLQNYLNGNVNKKITYDNGVEIEKLIYNRDGLLLESLLSSSEPNYYESIVFYDNGNKKEQGFYSKNKIKDNIWTSFDIEGNKIEEIKYNIGKKISEGKYKNNKKDGIWRYYLEDGESQKNITYNLGVEKESKTFKTNHLFWNHYNSTDDVLLLEYTNQEGVKENIAFVSDQPFTKNVTYQHILGTIARSFLERMKMVDKNEINENTIISKKIFIGDINVTYKQSRYKNKFGEGYLTGYDAFIFFKLKISDADNNEIFYNSYKMNKSDKLLNAVLNTSAQTFARTKNAAFVSSLKSIKFKKLFKKYFPIDNRRINKS